MRRLVVATLMVFVMAAGGCGKTRCGRYADMELACTDIPKSEVAITRQLAEGMCADPQPDIPLSDDIQKEADCAVKAADCPSYLECKRAVRP